MPYSMRGLEVVSPSLVGSFLAQPQLAIGLLGLCKRAYIHTALETFGHTEWVIFEAGGDKV